MSEPSAWWPITVPASRWFTEEERRESRRYHEPVQRAAVLRSIGQILALTVAWWVVARRQDGGAWLVAVGLASAAISVPRLAADAWHEFVHEPRFGVQPVASEAFVLTAAARLAVECVVLAAVSILLRWIDDRSWVVFVIAAACGTIPVASAAVGPRIVLALHRAIEVSEAHEAHGHVADLAAAHGLPRPRLVELDDASFAGANAYVTGRRSDIVVAMSRRLLDGPDELLRHVVGHEIAHLRRRHLVWSTLAASVAIAVTVGSTLAIVGRANDGGGQLPLAVLIGAAVSVPFRLTLAWLSRAHERQADRTALHHAPVGHELIKQLHLSDRPLLEPSRLARWLSSHPTPAERLETAVRSCTGTRII